MSVVIHALSPSMAKPLSKRQRTEVRRIVQQEISPEWKCKQTKLALNPLYLDVSNTGAGISLFAPITQGLGPDDRIGRKIKVHRVDIWYSIVEARQPQLPGPIPVCAQLYRRKSSAGPLPSNGITDRYDVSLYPHALWGPAPRLQGDKYGGNIHFYKLSRHWMAGAPLVTTSVWDRATPGLYVNTTTEAGFATTGVVQTFPSHNHYPNAEVPRSDRTGAVELYKKKALKWRSGLNVGFYDADIDFSHDENFINFMLAYAAPVNEAAAAPTHCACVVDLCWRVWFTDA